EALADIQNLTAELTAIQEALNLTDTDFIHYHAQECKYLEGLKQTPVKDHLSIYYIGVLDELAKCQNEWNSAREAANHSLFEIHPGSLHDMYLALNQARIRVDTVYSKLQNTE
ncbi:hypothetical protein EDD22DRAFT_736761, partial [Suillus occidentalis]